MQHHWRYNLNNKTILWKFKTIIVLFLTSVSYGQVSTSYSPASKGQVYIMWGWNRGAFTKGNISFKGADYDFKLYKVKAHDRPTPFSYHNYLQPNRLTIPQTNFRLGFFIKNNIAVSFGFDHMKYVMDKDQTVRMNGNITHDGPYKGSYNGDKKLTSDFLTYEHTDGLNYINFEIEKFREFYHSKSNKLIVSWLYGGGTGILFPRTDVTLLNYERTDEFHVSGFGISAKAGLQLTLFKHFLIKLENKYGYINMPDVKLHKSGISGKAKQAFFFTELDGMLGASFRLGHKQTNKK
jgi:hypothetical protein